MAFDCPRCNQSRVHITMSMELPPDSGSDEITLQVIECDSCGFDGLAVYQESRRGSLNWDSFTHVGYQLPYGEVDLIKGFMARCIRRRDSSCNCVAHRMFGYQSSDGRWIGMQIIRHQSPFSLR